MPFTLVPFVLITIPLLEIAAFILVGREIGVLATLALVFATAVIGSILLRLQGFGLIDRIRRETEQGRVPGRELVHGAMILVAGILLLTPGFVTDTIGFLLFVPAFRDLGWRFLRDRMVVIGGAEGARGGKTSDRRQTIDLDPGEYGPGEPRETPWRRK